MNETLLFINIFLFASIIFSLCFPYKHQVNIFFVLSSIVLCYFSVVTFLTIVILSIIVHFFCNRHIFGFKISIALIITFFLYIQSSINIHNDIVIFGVIYMVCRQIHYVIESSRNNLQDINLFQYIRYQLFVPCLIAGPIHRLAHFEKQLRRRFFNWEQFSDGLERLILGNFKVIVLGALLDKYLLVNFNEMISNNLLNSIMLSIINFLNLYILFSGYTDIAKGYGKLLGIELPENFDQPLLSRNISEFWTRWHITLSTWCKDYIFSPIFAFSRSFLLATIFSMIVIGLWHEFSLRYILWGVYHGFGILIFKWFSLKVNYQFPRTISIILTLTFVISSYDITTFINNSIKDML